MPTFRNTLSVPSSKVVSEDGTECSATSALKIQMPGNHPKRKKTTFRTRRKFEIELHCPLLKSRKKLIVPTVIFGHGIYALFTEKNMR